ncbi:MAG: MotA/TolQ/ExbB proton channel family protein [Bacteroidota bacterium]
MNTIFGILLQIVQPGSDTIQTVAQTVETTEKMSLSVWNLALKGGWIMIPIAILSVIAVYLFVERLIAINKVKKEPYGFMNNIKENIQDGKIDEALILCKATQGPLARMIEKGVSRIGKPLADINTAIENVGRLEIAKLEKGMATLATVSGGAPMLGFLGTVMGMIRAFYDLATVEGGNINVQVLSNGIYVAMVTTVAGLLVGIVAYFCYNILVARVEKVVAILEAKSTEFLDILNEPAK